MTGGTTPRKCSKCRRPLANHPGRNGPQCQNPPLGTIQVPGDLEVSIQVDTPGVPSEGDTNSTMSETVDVTAASGVSQVTTGIQATSTTVHVTNPGQLGLPSVSLPVSLHHRLVPNTISYAPIAHSYVPAQSVAHFSGAVQSSANASVWPTQTVLSARPTPFVQPTAKPIMDLSTMASQMAIMQQQFNALQKAFRDNLSMFSSQPGPTYSSVQTSQPLHNSQVAAAMHGGHAPPALGVLASSYGHGHGGPYQPTQPPAVAASVQAPAAPTVAPTPYQGVPGLLSIETLGDLSRLPMADSLPEKTFRGALKGIYANLDDFLDPPAAALDEQVDLQPILNTATGVVSYKSKRQSRRIINFSTWLEAYMQYEKMMVAAHGIPAYMGLAEYKMYIHKTEKTFIWQAVYSFDIAHRKALSGISIEFSKLDPTLVAAQLTSAMVRSTAKANQQPSSSGSNQAQPSAQGNARHRSSSRGKSSGEICKNFNTEGCTWNSCRRQHKCWSCKGTLPYNECIFSGPCASHIQGKSKAGK